MIGGMSGPTYTLDWKDGQLTYVHTFYQNSKHPQTPRTPFEKAMYGSKPMFVQEMVTDRVVLHPTEKEWRRFRRDLAWAGVRFWRHGYELAGMADGTYWECQIEYPEWKVDSFGSNSYPWFGPFPLFRQAVSRLAQGRDFK